MLSLRFQLVNLISCVHDPNFNVFVKLFSSSRFKYLQFFHTPLGLLSLSLCYILVLTGLGGLVEAKQQTQVA